MTKKLQELGFRQKHNLIIHSYSLSATKSIPSLDIAYFDLCGQMNDKTKIFIQHYAGNIPIFITTQDAEPYGNLKNLLLELVDGCYVRYNDTHGGYSNMIICFIPPKNIK
jgi:hypothetical protein